MLTSNQEERDGRGIWHVWGRGQVGFWWGILKGRDHLEYDAVRWNILLKN